MTRRKRGAEPTPDAEPDNPSRLRDAIDRGRTGDKVAAEDPAAAPLGTDDEAGGHPPEARRFQALSGRERAAAPRSDRRLPRLLVLAALLTLAVALAVLAVALSL